MKNRTTFIASAGSVVPRGVFLTSVLTAEKNAILCIICSYIAEFKLRFYVSLNTSTGLFIVELPPLSKCRPGRPAPPPAHCYCWPVICCIRIGVWMSDILAPMLCTVVAVMLAPVLLYSCRCLRSCLHCVVCSCLLSGTQWAVIQRTTSGI